MPLYGIINDSPFIYAAQRIGRRLRGGRGGYSPGPIEIALRAARPGVSFGGVNIVFRKPMLDRLLNQPSGTVGRYLARKGAVIQAAARAQVGVKTGALRASIRVTHRSVGPGQYIVVGSSLNYALLHHEGSRPHIIRANRAQVLRFSSRGRVVFARQVLHPGTRPNRYLSDQLRYVRT
jgi:hypothetical protein